MLTRPVVPFLLFSLFSGCSSEPPSVAKMQGSLEAVEGLPIHRGANRMVIERCCSLRLGANDRAQIQPAIDSTVWKIEGSGYKIDVVYGAYDVSPPMVGYRQRATRELDSVQLHTYSWSGEGQPPERANLWLARVGGTMVDGVEHSSWGLRIAMDCESSVGCDQARELIETLRF